MSKMCDVIKCNIKLLTAVGTEDCHYPILHSNIDVLTMVSVMETKQNTIKRPNDILNVVCIVELIDHSLYTMNGHGHVYNILALSPQTITRAKHINTTRKILNSKYYMEG